ncbi:MAG: thiamine-phosphate pyrophosphorylase [Candidatus Omnitrophica bacterium]|nr:thiamine-phosphate pyrophosphorylase [Candidatus Omnitrophota bacterium]
MKKKNLLRILDANINRTKEGLRVCEDILRFLIAKKELTFSFKRLRHQINKVLEKYSFLSKKALLKYRSPRYDVGRNLNSERIKKNIVDLFFANIQRVEEALRVLEELSKIFDQKTEAEFRRLRFRTYYLEKKASKFILRYEGKKHF